VRTSNLAWSIFIFFASVERKSKQQLGFI
jgi:hypothetical protein